MKKSLFILLFFMAVLYLLPNFFRPLLGPEEFRTAEIAREMLVQKDFTTPRLLGARFFEAPPMAAWLTAASFKLFGFNAFALRLVSLLGAAGSALLLYLWCRKRAFSSKTAFDSAFLFLSSAVVIAVGTSAATADALWGFFMTGAMVFSSLAMDRKSSTGKLLFLAAAGIAIGCGFLTRGLTAFYLPLSAGILYLLCQRRWKEFLFFPWVPLLAALLLIAPWGSAIHKAEPDFWRQFLLFGEIRCFTTVSSLPFWLLPVLTAAGFIPGVFPVISFMTRLRQGAWTELWHSSDVRMALCFLGVSLLSLFIPVGSPQAGLLPCIASAALLGAVILDKGDGDKAFEKLRKTTTVFSFIFIFIGSAALLAGIFYLLWGTGFISSLPLKYAVWTPFLTAGALGMVTAGTVFFIHRRNKFPEPESFFTMGAIMAAVCVWFYPGFTASCRMPEYEMLEIASQLSQQKIRHPRLLAHEKLAYAAAWCFKDSTVQIINTPGELAYGHRYAVACGERPPVLDMEQITALIKNPERKEGVLLLLPKNDFNPPPVLLATGKTFTTAGAFGARYYPGKEDRKTGK